MRRDLIYTLLAVAVLVLTIVPIGTAVFMLGFMYGDSPCVMCWEQRIGMAIIALIGLFILRYGPRPKYIGLSVLVGAWGLFMGLRHVGMHAARDVGQGFSIGILGVHTYTWALFIYWVCIVTMGVLLMLLKEGEPEAAPRRLRALESAAGVVFLVVIAGNAIQAFASTGPPPYLGQGDPIRFSFNPRHWVWSLEEYSTAPVSLRGRWASDPPDVSVANVDPASGPLAELPVLAVKSRTRISAPLRGTVTDLAYDAAGDRFLVTTQQGIYILDAALGRTLRYTIVDTSFSVDLGRFAGAAFLDATTVLAVGENKSFVVLTENDKADADGNFWFFLESFDRFDAVSRSRFGTVRARMMYTMSAAFDPATNSIYTVTVPNTKVKRLVVSRFDRRDMTLSEEFVPTLAPDSGLTFAGGKRSLDELYITGAAVADGKLYAISAAHGVLLTLDLASHAVVAAGRVALGTPENATAAPTTPVAPDAHVTLLLDHERLDCFQLALAFAAMVPGLTKAVRPALRDQLERAASSIALTLAEGCARRTRRDRHHFFSIAQGSAMECAAAIDILRVTGAVSLPDATRAKHKLTRIVQMLVGLRRR